MKNKDELVAQVKALGQDLIDRAEELVGDTYLLSEFDIWLKFDHSSLPYIDVSKSYLSGRYIDLLSERGDL